MNKREHIYYFDYLRIMAGLFVVFMHVAAGPLRREITGDWYLLNLVTSLSFTAVPLFLMMSGYLTLSSEKTMDTGRLLKKRLPRLVVPLAGWTIVILLWRMLSVKQFSIKTLYEGLVSALSSPAGVHLWYMYTLIALTVISPILRGGLNALDRKGHILVVSIIGVISLRTMVMIFTPGWVDRILNVDVITQLTFFSGHLATYILGYYLGTSKKKIPNWILIAGIVVLFATITVGTYWKTVAAGEYDATFQSQSRGFEVVLAACIFLFFKQNCNKKSRVLSAIPVVPLSLPIYLMHNVLLSMMYFVGLKVDGFIDVVGATLINFVVCFLVMKTVATVKPLCYLATGMTFREACETCNWIYTIRRIKAKQVNREA